MSRQTLIFIHGMGEGDYSREYSLLYGNIRRHLQNRGLDPDSYDPVYVEWQGVLDEPEETVFRCAFPNIEPYLNPLSGFSARYPIIWLRSFMTFFFGDVVSYTTDNDNGIRKCVWKQIHKRCASGPYSILAHSLGSVIAFDYLYKLFVKRTLLFPGCKEEGENTLHPYKCNFRHLFTFGSPIGLYMLRQGQLWLGTKPFGTIVNPVVPEHRWLNFWDREDVCAYPLESLFALNTQNSSASLEDIEVETGHLVVNSHTHYWQNEQVAQRIAAIL
jgi:hypothetical protein